MFRSILVTLDDSSQAAETLAVARTVASATGGSPTLLRVVPRLAMVLASEAAGGQVLAESTASALMVRSEGVPTVQLRTLPVLVDGSAR